MKVRVRGVTYNSVKEAAEALGVSFHSVYSALDRGGIDKLGLGKTRPISITIEGITFRSKTEASLALGFSRSYLQDAMRNGSDKVKQKILFAALRYKARLEMEKIREESGKGQTTLAAKNLD